MPVWSVSEPFISLWVHDEPLGYQPAIGPRISFLMQYGQRGYPETPGYDPDTFGIGKHWNLSWFSYLILDKDQNRVVHFPGGGRQVFASTNDPLTNTRLTGDTTTGYTLTFPDGSHIEYGLVVTNQGGSFLKAFMTKQCNAVGQYTRFDYYPYTPSAPVIRLKYVVDAAGLTNTVSYVATNGYSTNLISQVVDAFGRTNFLAYDNLGQLTNTTDVAGISSSLAYDGQSRVTDLTTPYGNTHFAITEIIGTNTVADGLTRSILITQPDGGQQLYLYTNNAPGAAASYDASQIPSLSPFSNTFENTNLNVRNSFHWGARQFAALSTTNISNLTSNDFRKARMRHWLRSTPSVIGTTLSMERDPSLDGGGTVEGQKTWYDYAGKPDAAYEGTQSLPLVVAQVLPDGNTRFVRTPRNSLGSPTNQVSNYAWGGSVLLRTNSFVYDANGIDLLAVTNPVGTRILCNSYNTNHQVVTNLDALNQATIYLYDSSNRLASITYPSGLMATNIYGADNFLAQQIAVGFATNVYTYSNGLVLTHKDERGLLTTNTWDALQRLRRVDFPDGTFITNTYDKLDPVRVVDRLGYTNSFGYDSLRHLVAVTNAAGYYQLYDWCSCGALNSTRDAAGNFTYYYRNNQSQPTNIVFADGYSVTSRYNLIGQLTNVADNAGVSITNWFNLQGLNYASSNILGRMFLKTFDMLDRVTNAVDANGVAISASFDVLDRLRTRTAPDSGVESWGYTANVAGATSYTNQLNNVTTFTFDALQRKLAEIAVGVTTNSYTYNAAGDLLTLTDGKNQTTTWRYDTFGRQTNKVDAANNEIFRLSYNANNWLTNRWTPAKGDTVYKYDRLGNVTNVVYPVSPAIVLKYDALNRLTNMTDAVGTTIRSYNAVNQLLSEDGPWINDTVTYTYVSRFRSAMSLQQPTGTWTNGYLYDSARRLTNVTSAAGAFTYRYQAAVPWRPASLTLPGGSYITNTFDAEARLLASVLKNSTNGILDAQSYGYNIANQITTQTNTAGDYRAYTYDAIGQLLTATGKESSGANRWNEQFGYAYDAAGNLNWRTNHTLVQNFAVNNLNALNSVTRSGPLTVAGTLTSAATNVTVNTTNAALYADNTFAATNFTLADGNNTFTAIAKDSLGRANTNSVTANLPATTAYAYDLNGNLLTNGNQVLIYEDENQLVTNYLAGAWKTEFVYDGFSRRRVERDYSWSGSAWVKTNEIHFVYDGTMVIQHRNASNTPLLTLTRGIDLSGTTLGANGIGGLLAMTESSGTSSYYHSDGNGNVTALINASQILVAKATYDPYGRFLTLSGAKSGINPYWFSSQYQLNGYYHFLRRAYAPDLQRWLNRDPIGELGGINLSAYVLNDPLNLIDPLGFEYWQAAGGTFFGINVPSGYAPYVGGDTLTERLVANVINLGSLANNIFHHTLQNVQLATERLESHLGGPGSLAMIPVVGVEASMSSSLARLSRCEVIAAKSGIGATGKIGEDALKALGGESQVYFRTTQGGRYVDQLVNGIANESKVGYQSLTPTISRQIAKDVELIQTKQIQGATWNFFQSPVTGLGGPSQPLLNTLQQNGINVIIHP